jgi:hypothetical protein
MMFYICIALLSFKFFVPLVLHSTPHNAEEDSCCVLPFNRRNSLGTFRERVMR